MTDGDTIDFYRRRESQELQWAANARSPEIARIHLDMAAQYQERIGREPSVPRLEMPHQQHG